jgi:hypothetical protein
MRITRLELANFRSIAHLVLDNLPDTVVLVSANGLGKSTILEAIAGAHDLVVPYHQDQYPYLEHLRGDNRLVWPPHLRKPGRFGTGETTLSIQVQPNKGEQAFLAEAGIKETLGNATFIIENGRFVTKSELNPAIKKLFEFHSPNAGIGYLDYIPPIRFYPNQGVSDINSAGSDGQVRQIVSSFHRGWGDANKFSTLKTFIVSSIVNDATEARETGVPVDSLKTFRETFDHFFFPKRFIGPKKNPASGQVEILIQTPFGQHDIDLLSDGEKEILNIMGYLYQFRHLESTFVWDTPESHLNAALESRLYEAIRTIAPKNQLWLSTHSLEIIGSVPIESIFVLRVHDNEIRIDRPTSPERKARVSIYRQLGAAVGLQLVSSMVVFVEGKEADSDKRILERLLAPTIPAVNFVAGGDCDGILALGSRTNKLLEEASTNGDFLAVIDRDYREDAELQEVETKYHQRVFLWKAHEIENLFLQPKIVFETLKLHDQLGAFANEQDVLNALREATRELREWIAADWVRWEIHQQIKRPSGQIAMTSPRDSLKEYGKRVLAEGERLANSANVDLQFAAKLTQIDNFLASDKWLERLPGKQILRKFLSRHSRLDYAAYLATAVSTVIDKKIVVPDIERLKKVIHNSIGTAEQPAKKWALS